VRQTRRGVSALRRLAACRLAILASLACAEDRPIRITLPAGRNGEICTPMAAGDTLRWRFKAGAALDLNVHHRVGDEIRMPVDRKAVHVDSGEVLIDQRNDWCLMWTAAPRGKRVTVEGSWSVPAAKP